jgi:hypothetical protein
MIRGAVGLCVRRLHSQPADAIAVLIASLSALFGGGAERKDRVAPLILRSH